MGQKRIVAASASHATLIIGAVIMILPFVWMVLTSLKPDSEIYSTNWMSTHFLWSNYVRAWKQAPFGTFYINTIVVTLAATVGQLLTSMMAGYAFSKMRFFGKNIIFFSVLAALMIPLQSIMIPLYVTLVHLHWTNTLMGIIFPLIPSAFGTFLFKQFYDDIPSELEDAAVVDGAGRYRILFSLFLPLSKPILAAFGILSFLFNWNNFFVPLIVVSSTKEQTISLGLSVFTSANNTQFNLLMAATTLSTIPVLIVFLLVQRYFVQGIALSGIK